MNLEETMLVKLRQWFDTDHTIPQSVDKARLCQEAAMIANGVVRDYVVRTWKTELERVGSDIMYPRYGSIGKEFDLQRQELILQFLRTIGCDK